MPPYIYAFIAVAVLFIAWLVYTMLKKPDAEVEIEDDANSGPSSPSGLTVTGGLKESYSMNYTLDEMEDVSLTISWTSPDFLGIGAGKLTEYELSVHTEGATRDVWDNKMVELKIDTSGNIENKMSSDGNVGGIVVDGDFGATSEKLTVTFNDPYWTNAVRALEGKYAVFLEYYDSDNSPRKNFGAPSQTVASFDTSGGGEIAQIAPSAQMVELAAGEITGDKSASLTVSYPLNKRYTLKSLGNNVAKTGNLTVPIKFSTGTENKFDFVLIKALITDTFYIATLNSDNKLRYLVFNEFSNRILLEVNEPASGDKAVFKIFKPIDGSTTDGNVTIRIQTLGQINNQGLSENDEVLYVKLFGSTLGLTISKVSDLADPMFAVFTMQPLA